MSLMVMKIYNGIMENIDMVGFVFYGGCGMDFKHDGRLDLSNQEYRRIEKHT